MARDSAIRFKRAQLQLVQVHDFAAAAVAAFEQHARDGFGGFGNHGNRTDHRSMDGFGHLDAVKVAVLLPTELADHADLAFAMRLVRRPALEVDELLGRQNLGPG